MDQEEYKSLVYDISKYYDRNLSYEVTSICYLGSCAKREFGSSYMKMLINSTYGLWAAKESIQEKRSDKLKRILNG